MLVLVDCVDMSSPARLGQVLLVYLKKKRTARIYYKQNIPIVDFSNKMKSIDRQIKDFLSRNMYNHKKVIANTNRGKKIIYDLFKHLLKNPKKYISKDLFLNERKERVIADFIAGMTDRYAINLHKKIT